MSDKAGFFCRLCGHRTFRHLLFRRIYRAKSADSYYTMMGVICQELLHMNNDQCNDLMQVVYTMADFPYPGLSELRDRYTWNIQPFSSAFRLLRQQVVSILKSDDESGSDLVTGSPKHGASGAKGFSTPPGQSMFCGYVLFVENPLICICLRFQAAAESHRRRQQVAAPAI